MGDYSPWLSDHCPLFFELTFTKTPNNLEQEKLDILPKSFHFSPEDRRKFVETLKSPEMVVKLTELSSSENMDAQTRATKISDLLIEACDKAGIKPRKQKENGKSSEPWFDRECEKLKTSIKKIAKSFGQIRETEYFALTF